MWSSLFTFLQLSSPFSFLLSFTGFRMFLSVFCDSWWHAMAVGFQRQVLLHADPTLQDDSRYGIPETEAFPFLKLSCSHVLDELGACESLSVTDI